MALVKVKFAPRGMAFGLLKNTVAAQAVLVALAANQYSEESPWFTVNGDSEDAAEEAFDLTNNPCRQDERVETYGRGRSVSTGDILVVGEEQWLCCSSGWRSI